MNQEPIYYHRPHEWLKITCRLQQLINFLFHPYLLKGNKEKKTMLWVEKAFSWYTIYAARHEVSYWHNVVFKLG